MRVGLGPGVLMSYILQGLVHPARKVREVCQIAGHRHLRIAADLYRFQVYWRIYNTCYLGAQDAMVPYYPNLGDLSDEKNQYQRDVLYMWI
jgi:splicing factor 3B subunit 1